jgi:hypothetical protein
MRFVEVLLQTIISWPVALVCVAFYFRDDIRRLTTRLVEIRPSGVKLAQQVTPLEPTTPVPASGPAGTTPGSAAGVSPPQSAAEFMAAVRAQFSAEEIEPVMSTIQSDVNARAGNDTKSRTEFLMLVLAAMSVQYRHERNYNLIFGSQLELLARMNGGPLSLEVCRSVYDNAVLRFPAEYRTYSFDQWIGFLRNSGLVQSLPDGNYGLTPWGRGLLRYVVAQGLTTTKNL